MPTSLPSSIFQKAVDEGASDVHMAVDAPLLFRVDGELIPQTKSPMSEADVEKFVRAVLEDFNYKRLQEDREVDVSYALDNGVRMRVNCHYERGYPGLVARIIPSSIPTL